MSRIPVKNPPSRSRALGTNLIRTPPKLTNRNSVVKYIEVDLWSWLKDLSNGLLKLNFRDNFQSFLVENLSIPAGEEVSITNQFKISYPGYIPTGRIITRQLGDANIIDGNTEWSENHVFLRNPSANNAVISVLFFK
jgi:hypothetical protein